MPLGRYRILSPTLALIIEDGRQIAHTVPEGAIVWVLPGEPGAVVEIFWDDKKAAMASSDLASRAEKID
jgi:hypothetical protein